MYKLVNMYEPLFERQCRHHVHLLTKNICCTCTWYIRKKVCFVLATHI